MNIVKHAFLLVLLCGAGNAFAFFGGFFAPAPVFAAPVCEEYWYDEDEDDFEEPRYRRPVRRVHHVRHVRHYAPRPVFVPRPVFAPRPFFGFGMCKPGFSFHIGL